MSTCRVCGVHLKLRSLAFLLIYAMVKGFFSEFISVGGFPGGQGKEREGADLIRIYFSVKSNFPKCVYIHDTCVPDWVSQSVSRARFAFFALSFPRIESVLNFWVKFRN